jgi:hypothetical protein
MDKNMIEELMFYCGKCKKSKPATEFHKDKKNRDGISYRCKDCASKARRIWYVENTDKAKAICKRWRENNPGRIKAASKMYRENNIEKIKEYDKRYYQINREKINKYQRMRYARQGLYEVR